MMLQEVFPFAIFKLRKSKRWKSSFFIPVKNAFCGFEIPATIKGFSSFQAALWFSLCGEETVRA